MIMRVGRSDLSGRAGIGNLVPWCGVSPHCVGRREGVHIHRPIYPYPSSERASVSELADRVYQIAWRMFEEGGKAPNMTSRVWLRGDWGRGQ